MPETADTGSLSDQKLRTTDITECPMELFKVLPDCVLDSERSRTRLSELSLQVKLRCEPPAQSTSVAAASGSSSHDRDPPRASGHCVMTPPSTSSASSSTSATTSSAFYIPKANALSDVNKLPPGVDEKALQKLFPLNAFSDELNPAAAAREEEDRPLAGLCAALLGRAVRDGLGKAYVHGVLAVARTVAPAFRAATLTWRDPRSGLDLFDLALRHGHASTLLQLSSFSEEFQELLCCKQKQLSPRELSNKRDPVSKLEVDGSCKNDCMTADSSKTTAKGLETDEIKEKGCSPEDYKAAESSKRSSKARESCSKVSWRDYDSIALHLISVEHQRCDINRNQCPLLRPCPSRRLLEKNETANVQTSPSLTTKSSFSDKCSEGSEGLLGDPRDNVVAAMKSSSSVSEGDHQIASPKCSKAGVGEHKAGEGGNEVPTEASGTEVDVNSNDYGNKQVISESPIQVVTTDFVGQVNRKDSLLLIDDRKIGGSSSTNPYQETPTGNDPTHQSLTSALTGEDALKQLPGPKGILKHGRKRKLGPTRNVTFSSDTKSGSSDRRDLLGDLYSYYNLRRGLARTSPYEQLDSNGLDDDPYAHVYVNIQSRLTKNEGGANLGECSPPEILEEQAGIMEESRTKAHVEGRGSALSSSIAQPALDRLSSSPKKSANSYFQCDCTGCCWLKSTASSQPIVERASPKPEDVDLKAFEVKSSSSGKFASLSSFLTRKAGKAKKFVKNARAPKYSKQRSTSADTSASKSGDGLVAIRLQDKTLDTGYVDNGENCTSFARIQQERKADSQADGAISICSHGRLLFRGQSTWGCDDGSYDVIFSNPAFCEAPPPADNIESGTRQQAPADSRLDDFSHRDASGQRGESMTRHQPGASTYFSESVDDTLMAVDEMIRESVNQLSLLNVSGPIVSDSEVALSPLQREARGKETFVRSCISTTSASPEKLTAGATTTRRLDAAHSSQQNSDYTYCANMMPLSSVTVEVQPDTEGASSKSGPTPAGIAEDSFSNIAHYFSPSKTTAHLPCSRDLELDFDLPRAVAMARHPTDGEDFLKPNFFSRTVVGTRISFCEMGEHPEVASLLRELRVAA